MLREDKGWQFTLREVARRAGVSHAAPYKHFPDKSALLAELATLGFNQLREEIAEALSRARFDQRERNSSRRPRPTFTSARPIRPSTG